MHPYFVYAAWGAAALFVVFAVILWRQHVTLPNRPVFKGKTVHAWLDTSAGALHLQREKDLCVLAIPFGHLAMAFNAQSIVESRQIHHGGGGGKLSATTIGGLTTGTYIPPSDTWTQTVYEKRSTGLTNVKLSSIEVPASLHRLWCKEDQKGTARTVLEVTLEQGEAEAFSRWLWRHAKLLRPDIDGLRKAWDTTCQGWLAACRRQRQASGKPAVEAHWFSSEGIRYLAVEEDGSIHAARGEAPLLTGVDGLVGWGNQHLVVYKGGRDEMRFPLFDIDIRRLQTLVRKGKLRLI
ncbi:hypothetical protein [Luteibacter sp. CQ10]|uniref:hypothetical protein n=1 Tax=Luteibacter sp. CQ10 TaxID=2805821 RepID=UPI0034A1BF14